MELLKKVVTGEAVVVGRFMKVVCRADEEEEEGWEGINMAVVDFGVSICVSSFFSLSLICKFLFFFLAELFYFFL